MGGWYIYAFFELGLIEPKIKISYLKWIKYIRKYSVNNNIQEHFFYFSLVMRIIFVFPNFLRLFC
jgi:hypothetical protein